jgi:hypothetical protein
MTSIEHNIKQVRDKIQAVASKAGISEQAITLIAVTKTQSAEAVNQALSCGITHFGENKVQEATAKLPLITEPYACFHFIGHLQTNKVKALLKLKPGLIHSVDSLRLAQEISAVVCAENRTQEILLQVNTSGEISKSGIEPNQVISLAQSIVQLPNIMVKGLMTIGRLSDRAEDSRQDFKLLRSIFTEIKSMSIDKLDMMWLSMGMTNDFEIAIEEGANLIRIGSAIFGERQYLN